MHPQSDTPELPVLAALPELIDALDARAAAVLVAPPGTGKTTGVPPALVGDAPGAGRDRAGAATTVVVVPRRMAARAAAARMAVNAGEAVGRRFGYSVRDDRCVSRRTVVEAVTPGLLLRRIQADPELDGTATVILDEFHERSVDQDLLLALLLDAREGLRPDLRLLVMSATLQSQAVARLLGPSTPVVTVESPLHPVTTHWRPGSVHEPISRRAADVVVEAVNSADGDVLVFLPGGGEIASTARLLTGRLGARVSVLRLHGSLPASEQDAVLSRPPPGSSGSTELSESRRVILATAIAETSLTVPGVRVVIDSGLRRYQEVDPATGLASLRTGWVSRSGADQRRGRAAREAPGVCYRLWSRSDEELRRSHDPPEITVAELSSVVLATALWGVASPTQLRWLDPPPQEATERAGALLAELGALDHHRRPTRLGRNLGGFGFHPRVGSVAVRALQLGTPELAAQVLTVIDGPHRGRIDLADQLGRVRSGQLDAATRRMLRSWTARVDRLRRDLSGHEVPGVPPPLTSGVEETLAAVVLAGYADRIARRRGTRDGIYVMRHGGEVELPRGEHHLSGSEWIAVLDVDARSDSNRAGRVHLAVAVPDDQVEQLITRASEMDQISVEVDHQWDPADGTTATTTTRRLGRIVLDTTRRRSLPRQRLVETVAGRVRADGPSVLRAWRELSALRARVAFLDAHTLGGTWPPLTEESVAQRASEWVPTLINIATTTRSGRSSKNPQPVHHDEIRGFDPDSSALEAALLAEVTFEDRRSLDELAPKRWQHPDGHALRLSYGSVDGDPGSVLLSVRLQDLLGVDEHPCVGRGVAVTVELLSPAGRPLQRTLDLPGFWRGSYEQVRSEMRGRYPKHRWPERPWQPI